VRVIYDSIGGKFTHSDWQIELRAELNSSHNTCLLDAHCLRGVCVGDGEVLECEGLCAKDGWDSWVLGILLSDENRQNLFHAGAYGW
jgi:hypothetical protein